MTIDGATMANLAASVGHAAQARDAIAVAVMKKAMDIEAAHAQQLVAALPDVSSVNDSLLGRQVDVKV